MIYIHRDGIITRCPQLSTESAFQLEAAAFDSSTNMVSILRINDYLNSYVYCGNICTENNKSVYYNIGCL